MEFRAKIKRQGNSYCIPIRKYMIDLYDFDIGDIVDVILIKAEDKKKK